MTRHTFLRMMTAASGAWLLERAGGNRLVSGDMAAQGAAQPSADVIARISRVIRDYDGQGIHRTATETDNRSATWLMEQATLAGAEARLDSFPIGRVDVRAAWIETAGRRAEGLPLFDGSFTDARGLTGRLVPAGLNGDLALTSTEAGGITSEGRNLAELRRSGRYTGIVVITRGASAGLTPMNAADFAKPYGCPVLQVGSDDGAWLEDRAKAGGDARLVSDATRTSSQAFNVVASVGGNNRAAPAVVVITPRSGWWQCASERGGGIACWLEAIRATRNAGVSRTVRFLASSGHELGHFGLDAFLDGHPGLINAAAAWVHLGANIGAADGRPRLQASSDDIESVVAAALERAGVPVQQRVARGTIPGGEARNIHVGGGRYVSLLGTSPVFHSRADRWPSAVDAAAVARFAVGISEAVVTLATA